MIMSSSSINMKYREGIFLSLFLSFFLLHLFWHWSLYFVSVTSWCFLWKGDMVCTGSILDIYTPQRPTRSCYGLSRFCHDFSCFVIVDVRCLHGAPPLIRQDLTTTLLYVQRLSTVQQSGPPWKDSFGPLNATGSETGWKASNSAACEQSPVDSRLRMY